MFKYVGDISTIYQNIINDFIEKKLIAIDATLGNGRFMPLMFKRKLF